MRSTPCVILAGGGSRRFGTPKGLALLHGKPLIARVQDRLKAQTDGPIAVNTGSPNIYVDAIDLIVEDQLTGGLGPLAGVHAAMAWAREQGAAQVLCAPVDTPFLPMDLLAALDNAGAPAISASRGRAHPVCGLWPTAFAEALEYAVKDGLRAAVEWGAQSGAKSVEFADQDGVDPFFNINTREDLETAEAAYRASSTREN